MLVTKLQASKNYRMVTRVGYLSYMHVIRHFLQRIQLFMVTRCRNIAIIYYSKLNYKVT